MPEANKDVIHVAIPVHVNFFSGLIVGIVNSIAFHPADKAFYLRNIDPLATREHLFALKYWQEPLVGLRNTFYQRTLSNSIYFMMQGELNAKLKPVMQNQWHYGEQTCQLAIGLLAGIATGFFSNASYAVKFYTINYNPKGKPLENTKEMWKYGGFKPFFNGIYPGVGRDMVFGIFYEVTSSLIDQYITKPFDKKIAAESTILSESVYFGSRFFSATIATTFSSPLNYARNVQFKTAPQEKQPSVCAILGDVWRESNQAVAGKPDYFSRFRFFQTKFMIGVGTARAGLGMTSGQLLFNHSKELVRNLDSTPRAELSLTKEL